MDKFEQGPPPPNLDKIQKKSYFFSGDGPNIPNQKYQIKHDKPTKPNMDLYLLSAVFVTIGFAMSGVIVCDVKKVARLEDKLQDFSNC